MRVLVNALSARRGGSLVYAKNLLPLLARTDESIEYEIIAYPQSNLRSALAKMNNVRFIDLVDETSSPLKRFWVEHIKIPLLVRKGDFSWYFQVDDSLPPLVYLTGTKTIAVFHASIQLLLPHQLGDHPLKVIYWRVLKSLARRFATLPITVSFCAKGELSGGHERVFKRLQVVYHGVDRKLFNNNVCSDDSLQLLQKLPKNYILSVSTRNPHKNYFRLVEAYIQLVKQKNIAEHLVLIGTPVWESDDERIRHLAEKHGLGNRVHLLPPVDNKLLPSVYKHATAYVYPSLFDSFGLTPIEAMACGTPCAVSKFTALVETCGGAVEYFDPLDVESISTSLSRVILNEERREELMQLGLKHVQRYSWESAAQSYYRLLVAKSLPSWNI